MAKSLPTASSPPARLTLADNGREFAAFGDSCRWRMFTAGRLLSAASVGTRWCTTQILESPH